jgi:hypothetical protein
LTELYPDPELKAYIIFHCWFSSEKLTRNETPDSSPTRYEDAFTISTFNKVPVSMVIGSKSSLFKVTG